MPDPQILNAKSPLKYLPRKTSRNGTLVVLSRADYEARGLKASHDAQRRAKRGLAHPDEHIAMSWSRELERWIERERILLRIPLPRQSDSIDVKQSAPTVYEIDRSVTAPAVMNDATPSSPAQPTSSTPTAQS